MSEARSLLRSHREGRGSYPRTSNAAVAAAVVLVIVVVRVFKKSHNTAADASRICLFFIITFKQSAVVSGVSQRALKFFSCVYRQTQMRGEEARGRGVRWGEGGIEGEV